MPQTLPPPPPPLAPTVRRLDADGKPTRELVAYEAKLQAWLVTLAKLLTG